MSDLQNRYWWLRDAEALPDSKSPDSQSKPQINGLLQIPKHSQSLSSDPQQQVPGPNDHTAQKLWFQWLSSNTAAANEAHANSSDLIKANETAVTQESWWLFTLFLKTEVVPSKPVEIERPRADSWFWPFSTAPMEDSESDAEDESFELFRASKTEIETSRSSHYAIRSRFRSDDVELAVLGTDTANLPVRFNIKKRPITPHEILEKTIFSKPRSRPEEETSGDLAKKSNGAETAKSKSPSLNLQPAVLPHLDENLRAITWVTKLRLMGEAVVHGNSTSEKHLYKKKQASMKKTKSSRKAVVISIHSFLPTKLVRSLIGQKSGNAKEFAQKASEAISRWTNNDIEIQSIALEGQGTISTRVEAAFRLISNWEKIIKECDLLYVVASSVSTPVAVELLSKMLDKFDMGKTKIGLLCMGGFNCGPFPGLDTKVVLRAYTQAENEVIGELFELQRKSFLTSEFEAALKHLCSANVKISMVGAISDQVVPLSSSLATHIKHANIFRAVYAEHGDIPPFLMKLFAVILAMRNVGFNDQNLIRDLSERLQGAVGSGGHGRIFQSDDVYDVGVRFAVETTSLVYNGTAKTDKSSDTVDRNLFHIPWNVRGLVNDLLHIKHIENLQLLKELVQEYKEWEPITRQWKELKYCFAAFEDITIDELIL